jgi:hypothetical protein
LEGQAISCPAVPPNCKTLDIIDPDPRSVY